MAEHQLPIATGAEVRGVLRALLSDHRARTTGVCILFLSAAVLGLTLPLSLGKIVDAVVEQAGPLIVGGWVAAAAAGTIAAAMLGLWGNRVLVSLVQDILAKLREEVFASAMRLPVATIDDGESADLVSRVTGDVEAVAEAGGDVVPELLAACFAIAVSLVSLAAIDLRLALAGLVCVPSYAIGTRLFLRRSRVVFREVRLREAHRSQAVLEVVEGRETLTALSEEEGALDRVATRAEASIRMQIEGTRVRNRLFLSIHGGEALGMIALLAAGAMLSGAGALTVGMVTTAALVFHRLFGPIGQLIFSLDDVQRATIGLARLVGVIVTAREGDAERDALRGAEQPREGGDLAPAIELRDVSFSYPRTGRGVRDVSLRIDPATTTAFVGASGSGKSTVAKLIAGQYAPDSGSVEIEGGVLPYTISQELHWFRGGIAENLRLAAPEASDATLVAALEAVGAEWALDRSGSEQRAATIAESDEVPDEGRIQQLAIARALIADPSVVILDEPTADVGLQYRDDVEAAIARLREGRTAVFIAHRLAPVIDASSIAVFENGRMVQLAPHETLVADEAGPYRGLWIAQRDADALPIGMPGGLPSRAPGQAALDQGGTP